MDHGSLARRIDALLPQTQCTRCGYPGCLPYAEAVARGDADFDRCPPGGQEGIEALAKLLGRPSKELDPAVGPAAPLRVARIDEEACIGCTLCIQACPVDAIVGAAKRMHTVVPAWCSGCDLCVAPCPVDCIVMIDAGRRWTSDDARDARTRFEARSARANGGDGTSRGTPTELRTGQSGAGEAPRLAAVAAALERARARRRAASGAR